MLQRLADINPGTKFTILEGNSSDIFIKVNGPYVVSMSDDRSLSAVKIPTGRLCHWEDNIEILPTT